MPEGDTIWRTARTLHAALAGTTVLAIESSVPTVAAASRRLRVVGREIEAVEARGKHLLVRFAGGAVPAFADSWLELVLDAEPGSD